MLVSKDPPKGQRQKHKGKTLRPKDFNHKSVDGFLVKVKNMLVSKDPPKAKALEHEIKGKRPEKVKAQRPEARARNQRPKAREGQSTRARNQG